MHKIDAHVGNHPANRFASYMDVFPCTLLLPHVAMWDTVLIDHPLATKDEVGFQQAIRHFTTVHTMDEDCHELLDFIHSVAKLCKMDVQTYYIHL
jgi:DNA-binding transcriptional regulator/RsmH inhibitor MraZ